jgi:hypothetical protein
MLTTRRSGYRLAGQDEEKPRDPMDLSPQKGEDIGANFDRGSRLRWESGRARPSFHTSHEVHTVGQIFK